MDGTELDGSADIGTVDGSGLDGSIERYRNRGRYRTGRLDRRQYRSRRSRLNRRTRLHDPGHEDTPEPCDRAAYSADRGQRADRIEASDKALDRWNIKAVGQDTIHDTQNQVR